MSRFPVCGFAALAASGFALLCAGCPVSNNSTPTATNTTPPRESGSRSTTSSTSPDSPVPGPPGPVGKPGATPFGENAPLPPTITGPVQFIGSFNIKWFSIGGREKRTDKEIEQVAEVIKRTGMALVGLQEIDDDGVMDKLIAYLPGWKYVLGTSGRQQRCGILWDTARAAVRRPVEWGDVNVGLEASKGNLRAPLVAEAKVGKFDFTFIVVHMKAMFDDKALQTRREQMRRFRKRLEEYARGRTDKDIIIVGDFNDFVDSAAMREVVGPKTGGIGFVMTDAVLPKKSITHISPDSRIDHVVVSSPFVSQEEWNSQVETYPKPRGTSLRPYTSHVSDHLPIWAGFDTATDRD